MLSCGNLNSYHNALRGEGGGGSGIMYRTQFDAIGKKSIYSVVVISLFRWDQNHPEFYDLHEILLSTVSEGAEKRDYGQGKQ